MEDPVEIRCRMRRFHKRVGRRDDYGKLLTDGRLVLADPAHDRYQEMVEWLGLDDGSAFDPGAVGATSVR